MSLSRTKNWESIQPTLAAVPVAAAPVVSIAPAVTPVLPAASFVERTQAHFMDMLIVQGFSVSLAKVGALGFLALLQNFYGVKGVGNAVVLRTIYEYSFWSIWGAALLLSSLCYFVELTNLYGKTFGQAFWGLRVVGLDGKQLCFKGSVTRYGWGIVSYLSCGLVYRLGLLDKWSKSHVTNS